MTLSKGFRSWLLHRILTRTSHVVNQLPALAFSLSSSFLQLTAHCTMMDSVVRNEITLLETGIALKKAPGANDQMLTRP